MRTRERRKKNIKKRKEKGNRRKVLTFLVYLFLC